MNAGGVPLKQPARFIIEERVRCSVRSGCAVIERHAHARPKGPTQRIKNECQDGTKLQMDKHLGPD